MAGSEAWEYRNPVRVIFGPGTLDELPGLVRGRILIVASAGTTRRGTTERVKRLAHGGQPIVHDRVVSNPTIGQLRELVAQLRREPEVETIVAVGGGSTIDTAKVLSITLANPLLSLDELISGAVHSGPSLGMIAVPTTAGTGSEVTPTATVWDEAEPRKLSITGASLYPSLAIVDPELTVSLSWEATVGPGLDAWVQCFEAIWNRRASPVTTALARAGLERVPGALRRLQSDSGDLEARGEMALAALLAGLAISQTRTALAHSMSYPITARLGLPHGLACALLLPAVLAYNLEADDGRLRDAAAWLGLDDSSRLPGLTIDLMREVGADELIRSAIPDLEAIDEWMPEMLTPGRADNNMREATVDDLRGILRGARSWISEGIAP